MLNMDHCATGDHDTEDTFTYDGAVWCPKHLPPSGPVDPAKPGVCDVSAKIHNARAVWFLPSVDQTACAHHLGIIVREVGRRGGFGR